MRKDREYKDEVIENKVERVEPKPEPKKPTFVEHKVVVTIPKLNVREAPSPEAESLDTISFGQSVTIVEEKNGFVKTKYGNGWINLQYTRSE